MAEPKTETLEFELDRKQTLNAHGNSHWRAKMSTIKYLRNLSRERGEDINQVRDVSFDKFKVLVIVKPPKRTNIDPPNFYPTIKPIIDGLTDAGWWEDDSLQYLLSMEFRYGGLSGVKTEEGKNNGSAFRFIIHITEIIDDTEYITEKEFID